MGNPFTAAVFKMFGIPESTWDEVLADPLPPMEPPGLLSMGLTTLPPRFRYRGCYKRGERHDALPSRALKVQPDMARDLIRLDDDYHGAVRWSDLLRSPASSLRAVQSGRGAQPPGHSTHNIGKAGDCVLTSKKNKRTGKVIYHGTRELLRDQGLPEFGRKNWKPALDELLAGYNLHCFRKDGRLKHETWHYGHRVDAYDEDRFRSRMVAGERQILDLYGSWWTEDMTNAHVQVALQSLQLYEGAIDGLVGPLSREGLAAFQRTWRLHKRQLPRYKRREGYKRSQLGQLDLNTKRVLAIVTARIEEVELVSA
jgi:hypothetical protein